MAFLQSVNKGNEDKNNETNKNKKNKKRRRTRIKSDNTLEEIKKRREEFQKLQSNVKEILLCSNATPILRRGDVGYVCCYCPKQFPYPANLKKHCHEEHEDQYNPASSRKRMKLTVYFVKLDITDLRCKLCNNNIDSLEELLAHLQNEHKRTIHTDVTNAIMPFKFHGETIKCWICSSVFERFKTLHEHMHIHYRNFICDECDMGFLTKGSLIIHLTKHKLGSFKCGYCSKIYDTERKKKSHEKTVHILKNKPSKCGYCNERFNRNSKREEHMAEVHGLNFQKYKCRACDKLFTNKGALNIHTRRDHLMERNHKCSQCEMTFFTNALLRQHLVKHSGVKAFKCEVCQKSYARKKTLSEHMKIHNDVRKFKCEQCGQAFIQKCSLKNHIRIRHDDKK